MIDLVVALKDDDFEQLDSMAFGFVVVDIGVQDLYGKETVHDLSDMTL